MKTLHVVITGGSRGLGRALAYEFLKLGCRVTVNGTSGDKLNETVSEFNNLFDGRIAGFVCDVTDRNFLEKFYEKAESVNGKIDIWINNAGIDQQRRNFWEIDEIDAERVFDVNIMGTVNGCSIAARRMMEQGFGQIYNMEGMGSDGRIADRFSLYGASKSAVRYLTDSFRSELVGKAVYIGVLSPGIVVTDFLIKGLPVEPEKRRETVKIYNILADKPETIAEYLAAEVIANNDRNKKKEKISWLTGSKAFFRFLFSAFNRRDLFND